MITDIKATNAIFLGDKQENEEQRPFKARFLQAGLVKYDFGVCLLKKETIDKFINTFIDCPVIIDHKDNLTEEDRKGTIKNIWFSPEDGWFWCDGVLNDEAAELVENGYNVSCQYRITEYTNNFEHKLHNGNEYDKEILNGIFEHLAIVANPRYEDAYIAVNAIVVTNGGEGSGDFDHAGRPGEVGGSEPAGTGRKGKYDERLKIYKSWTQEKLRENIKGLEEKIIKGKFDKSDIPEVKEAIKLQRSLLEKPLKSRLEEFENFKPNKQQEEELKKIKEDANYYLRERLRSKNSFYDDFKDYVYNTLSNEIGKAVNGWVTLHDKEGEPYHVELDDKESKKEEKKENRTKKSLEERIKDGEKRIEKDYIKIRTKEFLKSVKENPKMDIVFTNDDSTWLLTETRGQKDDKQNGWDLVKGGKVIKHFDDKYKSYDEWDKGYFPDITQIDINKAQNYLSEEGTTTKLGELIAANFDENKINRDEQGRFAEKGESTSFKDKILKIKPIQINKDDIPHFETKKELSDWVKSEFEKLGSVKIKDAGIDLKLSSTTANRETSKRRAYKEENKAVFVKFEEIVSTAIKKDERKADDRHIKDQEIYYNKFQIGGVDYDVEIFVDKPASGDKNSYYAGHKATKIKITPRDSQVAENSFNLHSKGASIIIPLLEQI